MTAPKKKRSPLVWLFVAAALGGVCVVCSGVGAAVAIPSFVGYVRRSKTAEAHANLRVMAQGVIAAWDREQLGPGGTVVTHRLPPALPPTPATPPSQLKQMWPHDAAPGWSELGFTPPEPLYYVYEYAPDPDGAGFVVRARGDLDGDGTQSLFELRGVIDPAAQSITLLPITTTDELE